MNKDYIERSISLIKLALEEDIQNGDITTSAIVDDDEVCNGKLVAKESGVIAGLEVFRYVFKLLDGKGLEFHSNYYDGAQVQKGNLIAEFSGQLKTVLSGERTALNFLQRMSGVATITRQYAEQLKDTNTELLDTRKTMPGFRYLDKYAVAVGGGTNHRIGLFDMVMLKENHIKAAGSISKAVKMIREQYGSKYKIEIETGSLHEVVEALDNNVDIIMLDNMPIEEMQASVIMINKKVKVEASGNITIANIRAVAEIGVDYISVGAITHSVSALDISLLII
ncbi:Quinolinate phosphoribosyltransferase [decarboxylating] [hydrothermal vent metagenome]|uniref:Probable nicotinate-nucleotide pyrophosphorylase [carboxylating] n=1 Tax=hydrothermal vent metagenome TaxID=652676 RepID=A0A3B1BS31_9ZZZZ